jgi:serine/threonine protein phosphatase PrpC
MKIISIGISDTGKVRKNNEDSYLADDGMRLYVVADGIGGHEGGEVASRLAIEEFARVVRERFPGTDAQPAPGRSREADPVASALDSAFMRANSTIIRTAAENPSLLGMGTTMTALLLRDTTANLAHMGDSRAYHVRDGVLTQVTEDHTVIAEKMRAGLITPGQAKTSSYRHVITRALGIARELIVEHRSLEVRPGDTFLLCTDGLTEMVEDAEIRSILSDAAPGAAAGRLVRAANKHGGVDNITVVVVHIEENQ